MIKHLTRLTIDHFKNSKSRDWFFKKKSQRQYGEIFVYGVITSKFVLDMVDFFFN